MEISEVIPIIITIIITVAGASWTLQGRLTRIESKTIQTEQSINRLDEKIVNLKAEVKSSHKCSQLTGQAIRNLASRVKEHVENES